jgi:hypothetical protein
MKLNQLIDEGNSYAEVIALLGQEAEHITEVDMCRWYKSGFQQWLKNQLWLEDTRSRLDMAIEVIAENGGPNVHQANLHIAATQLIQDLMARGEDLLQQHADEYLALINSVTRLSHEALNFHKYYEACAVARTELKKLKDPGRKLTQEETLAIVDHVDRILGFK